MYWIFIITYVDSSRVYTVRYRNLNYERPVFVSRFNQLIASPGERLQSSWVKLTASFSITGDIPVKLRSSFEENLIDHNLLHLSVNVTQRQPIVDYIFTRIENLLIFLDENWLNCSFVRKVVRGASKMDHSISMGTMDDRSKHNVRWQNFDDGTIYKSCSDCRSDLLSDLKRMLLASQST